MCIDIFCIYIYIFFLKNQNSEMPHKKQLWYFFLAFAHKSGLHTVGSLVFRIKELLRNCYTNITFKEEFDMDYIIFLLPYNLQEYLPSCVV